MDNRLIEILEEIQPEVDYETCNDLVDGHYLNSLAILSLIAELEEEYDITIPTVEIVPDNFNSAEGIWNMIQRLQEEE
ncbi:MAG: acyl carrier protein [Lachnospiraceae bacterium]|nr:acyl carrier protein [Lachnospiraceae bacterium]